ncbi:MAG: demethoxyubiquinone hydroxylase family protein [Vicinamibacterales bacterium]
MSTRDDLSRYRANLQDEIDSAALYLQLAGREPDPQIAEVFRRMAAMEEKHARFWEEKLRAAGVKPGPWKPSWRSRTLAWLGARFGTGFVSPTIEAMENAAKGRYDAQAEAQKTAMPFEERSHARVLRAIAGGSGIHGGTLARLEGRHRGIAGNALRAAVLGVNDGLVSNLSLVMGVAGAQLSSEAILITGFAGLLAGAGSMAMGEWLSVQSSRELYERQIEVERDEIEERPEEEAEELSLIYQAKGLDESEARQLAERLLSDKNTALDTLAREELGVDPEELGGSAWEAAVSSFVLFILGAIVPVLPFVFLAHTTAVMASVAFSAVALFGIGAGITLLTGRGVAYSGTRQLLVGLGAAALTFGVGRLLGVSLAG